MLSKLNGDRELSQVGIPARISTQQLMLLRLDATSQWNHLGLATVIDGGAAAWPDAGGAYQTHDDRGP